MKHTNNCSVVAGVVLSFQDCCWSALEQSAGELPCDWAAPGVQCCDKLQAQHMFLLKVTFTVSLHPAAGKRSSRSQSFTSYRTDFLLRCSFNVSEKKWTIAASASLKCLKCKTMCGIGVEKYGETEC